MKLEAIIAGIISGLVVGSIISCNFTLKKILNILKQMNGEEPTAGKPKKIKMQNIKFK